MWRVKRGAKSLCKRPWSIPEASCFPLCSSMQSQGFAPLRGQRPVWSCQLCIRRRAEQQGRSVLPARSCHGRTAARCPPRAQQPGRGMGTLLWLAAASVPRSARAARTPRIPSGSWQEWGCFVVSRAVWVVSATGLLENGLGDPSWFTRRTKANQCCIDTNMGEQC